MPVLFSNNASAPLAASITAASTSITVTTGQGALFPAVAAGSYFYATLVDSSNNLEIVKVTARSGDTMTVTRAQEGTAARAYAAADKIELRVTAAGLGNLVQLDGAQTVTGNKTFSGSIALSGGGSLAGTFSGTATFSGAITFSNTVTANISGNAGTVTNGVYTTGDQTIAGVKTFTSTISGNISGNAGTVTNGVYTTGDQTIAGTKIFTGVTSHNMMFASGSSGLGASVSGNAIFTGGYASSASGRLFIGDGTGWVYSFSRRIGGNTTDVFSFSDTGNFYAAGNITAAGDITAAGNITAAGDITAFSDERLKQNWRDLPEDFIERLAGVLHGVFERKDTGETQVGVGAKSLQGVLPQAVRKGSDGFLSVAYGNAALAACVMLAQRLLAVEKKLGA